MKEKQEGKTFSVRLLFIHLRQISVMKELICIFIGGGMGSLLRYLTSGWLANYSYHSFPSGTFVVNLLGCFLIGIFYSLSTRWNLSLEMRLLLTTGLCGGFTTFSTFSHESLLLLRQNQYTVFGLYITLSILLGIVCVFAGAWTGNLYPSPPEELL